MKLSHLTSALAGVAAASFGIWQGSAWAGVFVGAVLLFAQWSIDRVAP